MIKTIPDVIIDDIPLGNLGIIVKRRVIGTAKPNYKLIAVPGASKKIDVTDFIGLTFDNRPITVELIVRDRDIFTSKRLILESFNGKRVKLAFSDDDGIYWSGRLTFEDYSYKAIRRCDGVISLDADPFPYNSVTGEEMTDVQNYFE